LIVIIVVILTFVFSRSIRPLAKQKAAVLKRGDAQRKTAAFPDGPSLDRSASNADASFRVSIQVSCQLAFSTKTNVKTMGLRN
jgi:hypothetical protein